MAVTNCREEGCTEQGCLNVLYAGMEMLKSKREKARRSLIKYAGLLLCLVSSAMLPLGAQSDTILTLFAEAGATVSSTDRAPFWLFSNSFGALGTGTPGGWIRAGFNGYSFPSGKINLAFGADIIDRYDASNAFLLQQAYAGLTAGPVLLKAGRWEENHGNQYNRLSSGGLIWSGNARPETRISLSIPEFIPVPFTNGFAEIKGGISHGWLGNDMFVNNILLHHKYFYIRLGGTLPLRLNLGMHHFAQWGGISSDPDYGELPHSVEDYFRVFFGKGGSKNAYWTEFRNATGNHLGSYNLGIDASLKNYEISFYWQTLFEDGSGMRLRNISDGLWGLKITLKESSLLSAVLFEYLNTTNQSGTYDQYYENDTLKFAGGNDNYFNSGVYKGGWSYNGMTIGTPLITSPVLLSEPGFQAIRNNKVTAVHMGFEGSVRTVSYMMKYTFSRNYGYNGGEFPGGSKQCHSFILKANVPDVLPYGLTISGALAFDAGELTGNNFGCMISLIKNWQIW
mgnify:FL=1